MNETERSAGQVNQCGAKTRNGSPCRRTPTPGRRRCRLHGGLKPIGQASPHWRSGKHSRVTKMLGLRQGYDRALNDPDLLSVRNEIALCVARVGQLLDRLVALPSADGEERRATADALWREILHTGERQRKLVETETKVLLRMGHVLTHEQALAFVGRLAAIHREYLANVSCPACAQVFTPQAELSAMSQAALALVERRQPG